MIVARFVTTKNPTHEDHDEGDHVHEEHDGHCSASGSEDCLVRFSLFNCAICLYSGRSSVFTVSLCILLDRVVRPCTGLSSKPVLWKKRRNSFRS